MTTVRSVQAKCCLLVQNPLSPSLHLLPEELHRWPACKLSVPLAFCALVAHFRPFAVNSSVTVYFTPHLFGALHGNSGVIACLFWFVKAAVKSVNHNSCVGQTAEPRWLEKEGFGQLIGFLGN